MVLDFENIFKSFKNIKSNKVVGFDGILSIIIFLVGFVIIYGLENIFKCSFVIRIVFILWKRVKVIFIFKKGVRIDIVNYRFIFLLCILSKLFEY